jgi:hypothetical protein
MRGLILISALTWPAVAAAWVQQRPKSDPIAERLLKSKQTFDAEKKEAKEALLKLMHRQYDQVKKNKRLRFDTLNAQLKRLEVDMRAFDESDILPDGSAGMKPLDDGVKKYKRTIDTSRKQLLKEYDVAVGAYRRKNDIARARAVDDERRAFTQQTLSSIAQPSRTGVLLATGEGDSPARWLYTTVDPGAEWASPQFDDHTWSAGYGVFGQTSHPNQRVRTQWNTPGIWLRTMIIVPGKFSPRQVMILRVWNDDDAEFFVNGKPLLRRQFDGYDYRDIALDDSQRALFRTGNNTIAVHCVNRVGPGQGIDVGLGLLLKE